MYCIGLNFIIFSEWFSLNFKVILYELYHTVYDVFNPLYIFKSIIIIRGNIRINYLKYCCK